MKTRNYISLLIPLFLLLVSINSMAQSKLAVEDLLGSWELDSSADDEGDTFCISHVISFYADSTFQVATQLKYFEDTVLSLVHGKYCLLNKGRKIGIEGLYQNNINHRELIEGKIAVEPSRDNDVHKIKLLENNKLARSVYNSKTRHRSRKIQYFKNIWINHVNYKRSYTTFNNVYLIFNKIEPIDKKQLYILSKEEVEKRGWHPVYDENKND